MLDGSFAVYISDLGRVLLVIFILEIQQCYMLFITTYVFEEIFSLKELILLQKLHTITYTIRNFTFITTVVIPFFNMHAIEGVKAQDFADFKKVSVMDGK